MVESILSCIYTFIKSLIYEVFAYFDWFWAMLDYYIPAWKIILFSPIVLVFIIMPITIVILLYVSSLMQYLFKRRSKIMEAINNQDYMEGYRRLVCALWAGHGSVWHNYEVKGMENIPDKGQGVLLVYYHGAIPIDLYYMQANLYLAKGQTCKSIVDNFVLKFPGLAKFFAYWGSFPGPRTLMVKFLKEGEIVSVAPGGLREALFSHKYNLVWGERCGFAKAAIEANVPILPMFTENCRQAFNYIGQKSSLLRRIYEKFRLPFMVIYGGFPVKMTTYIGQPITWKPGQTASELANETKKAMQSMIRQYQDPKPSICKGLYQRFVTRSIPTVNTEENESLIQISGLKEL